MHETENCLYTTTTDEGLMETMFHARSEIKFFESKNFRGWKKITTKKSKKNRLTPKADFKYRLKEVQKKNQNANKRIETFVPISKEGTPKD